MMKNWTLRIQMQFINFSWRKYYWPQKQNFWTMTSRFYLIYLFTSTSFVVVLLSRMENSISVSLFKTSVASYLNSFRITHKWQTDIYTFTEIIMSIFIDQNYLIWISSLTLSHFSLWGSNLWNLWEQFPWYILSCLPLFFFFLQGYTGHAGLNLLRNL